MNTASPKRRLRTAVMAWLLFVIVCAVFMAAEWGTFAAWQRVRIREIADGRSAMTLTFAMRDYAVREEIPHLETAYNGGRPLPREIIDLPQGRVERILVPGERIDPDFAGWLVRIDYSVVPGTFWNRVRALPPARSTPVTDWLGSDAVHEHTEQLRRLVLILCGAAWGIAIVLSPFAGPLRRRLAQVAIAGALLSLVVWSADPSRPELWSLPKVNWIFNAAGIGLAVALIAVTIPAKRRKPLGGRCTCGYDLTGNVSGVCPECGAPTPAERQRRRDAELAPLVHAIEQTEDKGADLSEDEDALATG